MNKRQRKKQNEKYVSSLKLIKRLEILKRNCRRVLGKHKYIKADQFEIIIDRIIDEIYRMK